MFTKKTLILTTIFIIAVAVLVMVYLQGAKKKGVVGPGEIKKEEVTEQESIKGRVLNEPTYKNLVKAYEAGKLTDSIFNEFIKVVAFVNQPDLCQELAQELRQECIERAYILRAKREDNTGVCDNIITPAWKDECYAQVLTRRAGEQNNPEICEQIIKEEDRIKCRNEF